MRVANDVIFVLSLVVALIFALPNLSLLRSTSTFDYILGTTQLPTSLVILLGGLCVICLQWLFARLGLALSARKLNQAEEEIAQLRAQLQKKEAEKKAAEEEITQLRAQLQRKEAEERAKEVQEAAPTAEEAEGN